MNEATDKGRRYAESECNAIDALHGATGDLPSISACWRYTPVSHVTKEGDTVLLQIGSLVVKRRAESTDQQWQRDKQIAISRLESAKCRARGESEFYRAAVDALSLLRSAR